MTKINADTITAEDVAGLLAGMREVQEADLYTPEAVQAFNARNALGVALRDRDFRYMVSFEKQGAGAVFQIKTTGKDGVRRFFVR